MPGTYYEKRKLAIITACYTALSSGVMACAVLLLTNSHQIDLAELTAKMQHNSSVAISQMQHDNSVAIAKMQHDSSVMIANMQKNSTDAIARMQIVSSEKIDALNRDSAKKLADMQAALMKEIAYIQNKNSDKIAYDNRVLERYKISREQKANLLSSIVPKVINIIQTIDKADKENNDVILDKATSDFVSLLADINIHFKNCGELSIIIREIIDSSTMLTSNLPVKKRIESSISMGIYKGKQKDVMQDIINTSKEEHALRVERNFMKLQGELETLIEEMKEDEQKALDSFAKEKKGTLGPPLGKRTPVKARASSAI